MGIIEGSTTPKVVIAEYDFAKDGGTVAAHTLRGIAGWDNSVPKGSFVTGGYIEVLTSLVGGGTSTVAITLEAAGDVLAADGTNHLTNLAAGRYDVIPDATGSTSLKTTVARHVVLTVAAAALTAGKLRVTLYYV